MRRQADFIVEHRINDKHDLEVGYVTCTPWKLYFDGSVCNDGQGIGAVFISLNGAILSSQTDWKRIAQIIKLSMKHSMGVKRVEAFGDSLLVVQQVFKIC